MENDFSLDNNVSYCCPQCGNKQLQVITETNTETTGKNFSTGKGCLGYILLGPLGLLCGSCGKGQKTTSTNITYWCCSKCGKKFRNPNELRQEAETHKKRSLLKVGVFFLLSVWLCVLLLVGMLYVGYDGYYVLGILLMLLCSLLSGLLELLRCKKIIKNYSAEADEIERGMRKFNENKDL